MLVNFVEVDAVVVGVDSVGVVVGIAVDTVVVDSVLVGVDTAAVDTGVVAGVVF